MIETQIPYTNPTRILQFFNDSPMKQLTASGAKLGEKISIQTPTLADYYLTIPEKLRNESPYLEAYHNTLLKISQKLVAEGLLTPVGENKGFSQQFQGNGYDQPQLIQYGYYDFMILGFPTIRNNFQDTVLPIVIDHNSAIREEKIGTCFCVGFYNKERHLNLYCVTAKHCLIKNSLITIIPFLPTDPLEPINIYFPVSENIDLAVIEYSDAVALGNKYFILDNPSILDPVLTMGFPPIQGLTDAIQVSETSII